MPLEKQKYVATITQDGCAMFCEPLIKYIILEIIVQMSLNMQSCDLRETIVQLRLFD